MTGTRRRKGAQTAAQKLDDAMADAETFIDSAVGELTYTLTNLRAARAGLRSRRLTLARLMRSLAKYA